MSSAKDETENAKVKSRNAKIRGKIFLTPS
jgi:hypothetical protein